MRDKPFRPRRYQHRKAIVLYRGFVQSWCGYKRKGVLKDTAMSAQPQAMRIELRKHKWASILRMDTRVARAYPELRKNAHRLA